MASLKYKDENGVWHRVGLGKCSEIIPIENGGTGATDAATALANLGAQPANNDLVQLVSGALQTLGGTAVDAGGAKIATGSYVGTDTYGSSNPNSLTFDFVPRLLLITGTNSYSTYYGGFLIAIPQGESYVENTGWASTYTDKVTITDIFTKRVDNTIYWYSDATQYHQMNSKNKTFYYVAIG